jgi:hypothetical protein
VRTFAAPNDLTRTPGRERGRRTGSTEQRRSRAGFEAVGREEGLAGSCRWEGGRRGSPAPLLHHRRGWAAVAPEDGLRCRQRMAPPLLRALPPPAGAAPPSAGCGQRRRHRGRACATPHPPHSAARPEWGTEKGEGVVAAELDDLFQATSSRGSRSSWTPARRRGEVDPGARGEAGRGGWKRLTAAGRERMRRGATRCTCRPPLPPEVEREGPAEEEGGAGGGFDGWEEAGEVGGRR